MTDAILKVEAAKKYFPIQKGFMRKKIGDVRAVDGVSFEVRRGETFGLVGESGCGKTTMARMILRVLEPTSGQIEFHSESQGWVDIPLLSKDKLKEVRKEIQMIFQDPFSSLNPRLPVFDIVAEPLLARGWKRKDCHDKVADLLARVGLNPAYMQRYPHAFSGGQRQRIGIARSLISDPSLVVADEPVSALDVSVQAQTLNLLNELQHDFGLTYLFIAHDLSVIRYICDRVAVMYLGKIVEVAETDALFSSPRHPYTSALMASVPDADPHSEWLYEVVRGEAKQSFGEGSGCSFSDRCPYTLDLCNYEEPALELVDGSDHRVACHRANEIQLRGVG
jgi:peptide/nickel transport system ATP-binding protein